MLLNCKKNWCFWTVVLEKTLESPLDCKIKPVNPKGSRLRIFIGRTDAEAEAPILWLSDTKSWLCKNPDAGKDWGQEKERATEDKMVGWHHPTQWTWVQANFRKWWSTGKPGVLQSIGLQRVGHVWVNKTTNNVLWSVQIVCQTSEQRPYGSEGWRCEIIWRKCVCSGQR